MEATTKYPVSTRKTPKNIHEGDHLLVKATKAATVRNAEGEVIPPGLYRVASTTSALEQYSANVKAHRYYFITTTCGHTMKVSSTNRLDHVSGDAVQAWTSPAKATPAPAKKAPAKNSSKKHCATCGRTDVAIARPGKRCNKCYLAEKYPEGYKRPSA